MLHIAITSTSERATKIMSLSCKYVYANFFKLHTCASTLQIRCFLPRIDTKTCLSSRNFSFYFLLPKHFKSLLTWTTTKYSAHPQANIVHTCSPFTTISSIYPRKGLFPDQFTITDDLDRVNSGVISNANSTAKTQVRSTTPKYTQLPV